MDIKEEITKILTSIFGEGVKKILIEHYDSNKPEELIDLAYHMLAGYMGEKNANRILKDILKKSHKNYIGGA
jgi:hypothetical protein